MDWIGLDWRYGIRIGFGFGFGLEVWEGGGEGVDSVYGG